MWNNTHTFRELLPNKSKQIFRVHIKQYFEGVTPKQSYTLFKKSNNNDIFRELLANNTTHFSKVYIKQNWNFQRVLSKLNYSRTNISWTKTNFYVFSISIKKFPKKSYSTKINTIWKLAIFLNTLYFVAYHNLKIQHYIETLVKIHLVHVKLVMDVHKKFLMHSHPTQ